jgi:CRP/FNR family transcriptional regulator
VSSPLRLPFAPSSEPFARLRSCWSGTIPLRLQRGDYLYLPGDPSRSVFLVREGFVRLARLLDSGRELTLDVAGPGDIVGEEAVMGEARRTSLAQALQPARVSPLPAATLESLLDRSGPLALALARVVSERSRRIEARALENALGDCRRRLSSVLLDLADRFGADEGAARRLGVRLTHEDLARLIGAARETVTPLLGKLRKVGILAYDRRRLLVRDPHRLRALAAGR